MNPVGFIVKVQPSQAALSLAEVKGFLHHDFVDDDDQLTAEIGSAQAKIEAYLKRKLITQTLTLVSDCFGAVALLPTGPVQSVSEVRYKDSTGSLVTLSSSLWQASTQIEPARLMPAYGQTWPTLGSYPEAVEVDVVVGYGDEPSDVPADIRYALRLAVATAFEKALENDESTGAQLEKRLRDMLAHRILHI